MTVAKKMNFQRFPYRFGLFSMLSKAGMGTGRGLNGPARDPRGPARFGPFFKVLNMF